MFSFSKTIYLFSKTETRNENYPKLNNFHCRPISLARDATPTTYRRQLRYLQLRVDVGEMLLFRVKCILLYYNIIIINCVKYCLIIYLLTLNIVIITTISRN